MPYEDLVARLDRDRVPVCVGAFPDGSVDDYYRLRNGESVVTSRTAFADAVTAGRDSFELDPVMTDAGGQAVNAARQAAALGDDVLLAGHLDHPIFAFDFPTASMGAPARVRVCLFDVDDVMLVEESRDLADWTFADLRDALDGSVRQFLERDALCCTNWASTPGLGAAFADIAALRPDGGVFCVDPGPLTVRRARSLLDAVDPLADAYDVVLSVNEEEASHLVAAADVDGGGDPTDPSTLDGLLSATRATGVVVHTPSRAVAATPDGRVAVPNLDVSRALSETGAGDRFSAALARSLAADWGWDLAVAAGNACGSYHVSEGGTADRDTLREYVETHRPR
jgi:sugar/nucleoside kinase (ribokinase family)